ncbi:SLC13 family permease [Siminovitchia acidinfaciens]|uniref:SLC13 family permease n=1 Tax=Siminovitchia acidinfaciens TaxID=2321395 RepID=A0A429XSV8_9BACI|nr:SLC13 family permease [Siminovitchia acidinfaciens]RST70301.1 SLC13 family permease [Siminovitchia acidinfaciens]
MTLDLILTFIILAVTIILFMSNKIRADLVAVMALLAFVLTGILSPNEALVGFSNSVVIMVAGLFIIGAGILRTGLAQMASNFVLRSAGDSEKRLFVILLVIVAFIGTFMSNTGTVAIMLPIVVSIAISINSSPSKFLIPLSYVASFSGLLTLIASPANLIASQTLVENGYEKLSFFAITPVGLVGVVTGIIYLYFVRNKLLPKGKNRGNAEDEHQLSPEKLVADYQLGGRLFLVRVPEESEMVGQRLTELKTPEAYQLYILKIVRKSAEGLNLLPMTYHEMAGPKSVIQPKDILYVQGTLKNVERMVADFGLMFEEEESEADELVSKQLGIAEVLLTPHSKLINQTAKSIGFREKYNLNILGINRQGQYVLKEPAKQRLRFGDALLVQGSWASIELLARETNDVVVVGQPQEHASAASASGKAPIAAAIILMMVILMVFEIFPTVISVLIGAVLMILTGCLRNMDDAYGQVNFETIVLVAAMLPIATALEKTGGIMLLSEGIIKTLGGLGSLGVFAGIYLLAMTFGQFISNTATAVLFAPIAMNAALTIDANPYTFLIGVAVASNMAFATPVASPTNAMVMTAGGYKVSDFVKIGLPLMAVVFVVMLFTIPFFFPL